MQFFSKIDRYLKIMQAMTTTITVKQITETNTMTTSVVSAHNKQHFASAMSAALTAIQVSDIATNKRRQLSVTAENVKKTRTWQSLTNWNFWRFTKSRWNYGNASIDIILLTFLKLWNFVTLFNLLHLHITLYYTIKRICTIIPEIPASLSPSLSPSRWGRWGGTKLLIVVCFVVCTLLDSVIIVRSAQ